jgi:hypothetical protein
MDGYADSLSDPVSGPDGPTPIPTLFTQKQNSGHPRGIGKRFAARSLSRGGTQDVLGITEISAGGRPCRVSDLPMPP